MSSSRPQVRGVEVDEYLFSKISQYSVSLFDTLGAYESTLASYTAGKFEEYQKEIAQKLDLSDSLADDVLLQQAMQLFDGVTGTFYRTTADTFRASVKDLKRTLEELCSSHWGMSDKRMTPEESDWRSISADAHRLLEKQWDIAAELLDVLQTLLTQTCDAVSLMLWSELCWFGQGTTRDELKAGILDKLKNFLKNSEPKFKEEIHVLLLSMQSVTVATWAEV